MNNGNNNTGILNNISKKIENVKQSVVNLGKANKNTNAKQENTEAKSFSFFNSNNDSSTKNQDKPKKGNTSSIMNISKDFMDTNTMVTKVIFILFLLIVFVLLMKLGMYGITLFFTPSKSPVVINGMMPTLKEKEFYVNPNHFQSKPVLRSINEEQGMEFTWSTWFWVNDLIYDDDSYYKKIFSKGKSVDYSSNENMLLMNAPGLYLGKTSNDLRIILNTFDGVKNSTEKNYEEIVIDNIPIQKWVNVIIRIQNTTVDVYINGTLMKRRVLDKVPKQNYGNIHVGDNKYGMNGYISALRYFDHAIGVGKIQEIMDKGPNLNMVGDEYQNTQPPYLALRWYFDQ
jgi:hypothetical protein